MDDPYQFGAIAAANALSDIYACGGEPKVVLNLAGFPEDWDEGTILPIVDAAVAKVVESGAIWAGGHTVRSKEPLFGFAVFGEVVGVHMRDDCVVDGRFDVTRFQPLSRLGYRDYTVVRDVFELKRPDD